MKYKHKILSSAIMLTCGMLSQTSQAAMPANGSAVLNFTSGVYSCAIGGTYPACDYNVTTVATGAYFAMDTNSNGTFDESERVAVVSTGTGLTLGIAQITGEIDVPWVFGSNPGQHNTSAQGTTPSITTDDGAGSVALSMSGWTVWWGAPGEEVNINMGAGPADATVICGATCEVNDTFTLVYTTIVPAGQPFAGVNYQLYMEGVIGTSNTAPICNDFSSGLPLTGGVINIAANVTDTNYTPTTPITVTNDASCGTVTDNGDGTVTFPACTANTYAFDYSVTDDQGAACNTAGTVTVTTSAGNQAPVAIDDPAVANGVTPVNIDVPANDTDDAGLDLTSVSIGSTSPSYGTITAINATTGVITYTADLGFSGTDTFSYTIWDADPTTPLESNEATVSVNVSAMNRPGAPNLVCGPTAISAGKTDCIINETDIGVADNGSSAQQGITQTCIGGCFDFVVTGVTGNTQVVIPLSTAIPTPATDNTLIYRKLVAGSWQDFDISGNNGIHTAPGTVSGSDIICPAPTDSSYTANSGINSGHRCLRLTIVDNGPNDSDATTGTIADPGGIAETTSIDTRTSGTDGCSMTGTTAKASNHLDWLLVAGFLGLLGLFRLKQKQG